MRGARLITSMLVEVVSMLVSRVVHIHVHVEVNINMRIAANPEVTRT
jgi:hypothetical protein